MIRCCGIYSPSIPHKDGNPLTNRTPTDKEQQLGWEYTKRLLDLHIELGGVEPLVLAVGQNLQIQWGNLAFLPLGCATLQTAVLIYIVRALRRL